ncbi:MAG: hypothetical protein HOC63_06600 [Rhodospirillales bacterium]|jgi:hypothetical protein|nr:hypothetical protein [Rhodospirillales bacterium]
MASLIVNGSGKTRRSILDFLACYLIIITHFTNYITHIGFTTVFPDLVLSYGLLFAIAVFLACLLQAPSAILRTGIFSVLIIIVLSDAIFEFGTTEGGVRLNAVILTMFATLVLVFFLRQHINKFLIAVFAIMFVSGVVLGLPFSNTEAGGERAPSANGGGLPVVVHLILDGHMGVGGMTPRLPNGERIRNEVSEFYLGNEFRLFSGAYSEYFDTHFSMARFLNADADEVHLEYAVKNRNKYVLSINGYFERWAREGYKINVLQSSYFDLCKSTNVKISSCVTYNHDSFDGEAISSLPLAQRIILIGNMYYSSFTLYKLVQLSELSFKPHLDKYDVSLRGLGLWHGRIGPLAISSQLEQLIRKVSRSNGGEFFFAHLLIPHSPYVYDSSCKVHSPVSSWQLRPERGASDTPKLRYARYAAYFEQIRCTMRKLQPLFDAMRKKGTYEDAVIIIHGDHGARITRIDPEAGNAQQMTRDDYIDSFSTLFALKAPGVVPGNDDRMASLPQLLAYAADRREENLNENSKPYVYLSSGDDKFVRSQIPEFPLSNE